LGACGFDQLSYGFRNLSSGGVYDATMDTWSALPDARWLPAALWGRADHTAVSLGGDSDTMACIAGAIAEAFYGGVPPPIWEESARRLPPALRATVTRFLDEFIPV